jgi:CheY-like chemotaxis protein
MRLVILVIDDERAILEVFQRLMRERHEVILEHDANRALARLLSEEEIDVTFLDLMLGKGPSGLAILSQLQAQAPARLERIVIATGALGIPGVAEELERYRAPTTGESLPVIEKPYRVPAIDRMIRPFLTCMKPRGPRYSVPPPPDTPRAPYRARANSAPRLPDYDEKEISKVTELAEQHEPVAMAIRDLRERMTKQEGHFEDNGPGKRGLVREISANVEEIRSGFRFIKTALPIVAILLGGLVWLVSALQPKPERVDYGRITREVATTLAPASSLK